MGELKGMFSSRSNFKPYWKAIPKTWEAIKCGEIRSFWMKTGREDPVMEL